MALRSNEHLRHAQFYLDADYQVLSPGTFVRCAVTGKPIPLDELKYWSVQRQEPYVDAETSLKRELEFMDRN